MSAVAAFKNQPLTGKVHVHTITGRVSIAEILAAHDGDVPAGFADRCEARVNGVLIERDWWHLVRPRVETGCDVAVTFTLPIHGGGGGGGSGGGQRKNPIGTVAMLAVLLVAAAVTGGAAVPLLGAGVASGTIGASIAGAAVGFGGMLAVSALIPPPTLRANNALPLSSSGVDGAGPNAQAASLSGNVLGKGQPIPRVIGTHRLFPPLLTQPLVDIDGDTEVAEAVYGLVGPHALSDLRIGTTTASSIPELETEIQEGLPTSPVLGLVTRQGYTDTTISVQMSKHVVGQSDGTTLANQSDPSSSCPQWEGLTTRESPDEAWLTFSLPAGLNVSSSNTGFIPFRIRIRQSGASSWINLPEFHYIRLTLSPVQFQVKLKWAAPPSALNTPSASGGPVRAYYSVPTQSAVAPTGAGGWTADSYFYGGSGDTYLDSTNTATTGIINTECFSDKIIFYLNDGTKFPKDTWEIQAIRGQALYALVASTYNYNGNGIFDLFGYAGTSPLFAVRLDQRAIPDAVNISRVASIWNESPVPDPSKFAVIGARVRGRSINQLSVLASGYVNDWDGSAWSSLTTTSNPAPHLYDILTGTLGGSPLPTVIVDSDSIVTWRTHCVSLGYEVNAVVEGKTYLDAAGVVCSAGFARLTHNEKWGVFLDKDRSAETPIQVFSPRNMTNFSWRKAFAKLPTGIRAQYNDSTNNYQQTETIVYDDATKPDNDGLEQIQYDGLVTATEVATRAAFDLLQGKKRLTFYSGDTDLESIVCQRGDLVAVQHDTLASQTGFARIKTIAASGGNVTGLTLDGSIEVNTLAGIFSTASIFSADHLFDLGGKTGIAIRLKAGAGISVKEVTAAENGDETTLTFVTPFADPGSSQLDADCLVVSGRLGSEYKRLIVYGVQPKADLGATITFVDEAPELWA